MNCRTDNRCNCQTGGAGEYPCKSKLDSIKKSICELEKCLKDIKVVSPTPPPAPGQCCCRCCCCCCCNAGCNGRRAGNQTTWGRCM